MSDFISYYPFFNEYPNLLSLPNNFFQSRFEPGFLLYTATFKIICTDYFCWVAFNTLIDLLVLAWFFHRYCKSMILPLIFFIAFNGLLMEFNLYRNMKAIDCFLLSIPYLQKKRWAPYFGLNIIGFIFHSSSILYLPLYFILNAKVSKLLIWSSFIVSNIIFLSNIQIISNLINNLSFIEALNLYDQISSYGENAEQVRFSLGYVERTISFILFSILYNRLTNNNKIYYIFFNAFLLYYCCFLIFYEVRVLVERIPYLFMFSYWVLYPAILNLHFRWIPVIRIFTSFLVILKIYSSFNMKSAMYHNILFSNPDYEKSKSIVLDDLNNR